MDFRSTNIISCCSRTNAIEYNTTAIATTSSHTNTNILSNKRKRRASSDDKDADSGERPRKRAQFSCYKSDSQPSSEASSLPSPVDEIANEIITISDRRSSSDCLSTVAEYDLGTPNSSTSSNETTSSPSLYHSSSNDCNNWQERGDSTPHANKAVCKTDVDDYVSQYCITPTSEIRLCPLPALSWANAADVWNLMCQRDERASYERSSSMLENHPGLQPRMRAILLDWLIEVCEVYKLHRETYYLAVDYLDRYLSTQKKIQKTHLQLIGITCLFIAAKVEEIYPPKIGEFAYVTDGACQEEDILQHELLLLKALDWCITPVTVMGWLGVYMQLNVSNRTPSSLSNKEKGKKSSQSHSDETCSVNSNLSNSSSPSKNNNCNPKGNSFSCNNNKNSFSSNNSNNGSMEQLNKTVGSTSKSINTSILANDSGVSMTITPDSNDAFIYPQFSGMEFVQTAQLIDLCSLDLGMADFPYSVIAAAAMSYTFNRETALRVSGLEWTTIEACARWMEPFFQILCEESGHLYLLEQNEQIESKFGLGYVCPNIVTDNSHIIQTHTTSMTMFDRVVLRREQCNRSVTLIQQEASPAVGQICPEGLLTPPASSRKPLEEDNEPDILQVKTS